MALKSASRSRAVFLLQLGADFAVEAIEELVERLGEERVIAERGYQQLVDADCGEAIEVVGDFGGRRQDAFDVAARLGPFRGEAQVHAMAYREAVEVAAAAGGQLANPSDALGDLLGLHPRPVPSVTQLDGAADCAPTRASNPNRDVARGRTRSEAHSRHVEELAMKFRHG